MLYCRRFWVDVGNAIKAYTDEIISHHAKYEMLNPKDPNKVETYYNKSLGNEKINQILDLINNKLLDGVAMKKSSRLLAYSPSRVSTFSTAL